MKQRISGRAWHAPHAPGRRPVSHRPRLLVEDARPALAVSDFTLFRDAGFDVAYCSGPDGEAGGCPLPRGERCPLLDDADVVLHGLDLGLGIAAAIGCRYPGLPVVLNERPCSVRGQVDALFRALAGRRHPAA